MTPPRLARRLLDFLPGDGHSWLELGSGDGRIAQACLEMREPSEFVGVELDDQLLLASPVHPCARYVHGDVLSPSGLAAQLGGQLYSRATGNPPYGMQAMPLEAQRRVADLCPGIPQVLDWVQLDLYFILESLARLRRPSEAAFIVGAPIAQDARLVAFRRALLASASEVECYELPKDVFDKKAEVQSYLLVSRFGQARLKKALVGRLAGTDLRVEAQRWIPMEKAQARLDFGFHELEELTSELKKRAGMSALRELGASIVRGSRTRWQFHELGIPHFHTTDFPPDGKEVSFSRDRDHGFQFAAAGDLLLPRVGTRCLDKQALVTEGQRHYTEAVYRLRVAPRHHARVVDWIFGETCTRWRQAAAKGSCAKHLTVASLLAMPVPSATAA
ncbi:MAG: hypothetical protein HZC37_25505 [Burkholderiales bacterium]|nr:hypothetical protein [Burkholderiales bacterium]